MDCRHPGGTDAVPGIWIPAIHAGKTKCQQNLVKFLKTVLLLGVQILSWGEITEMTETIINFSVKAYTLLLPLAWIGFVVVILVLCPLAFFHRTRQFAGTSMFFVSWLFGITTWFLGATITFATWGWVGLLIGLFLFGVGVVPVGVLAAFFSLDSISMTLSLIVMSGITYACRVGGLAISESTSRNAPMNSEPKKGSDEW